MQGVRVESNQNRIILGKSGAYMDQGGRIVDPWRYLLDEYNTSVYFAYALFQLSSLFAGDSIKVRETGGNTEADIPFDPVTHWVDEAALLAHCGANSGFVVTEYEQGGTGADRTQAIMGTQPQIVNAGVVLKSGGFPAKVYGPGVMYLEASYQGAVNCQYFTVRELNADTSVPFGKKGDGGVFVAAAQNGSALSADASVGLPTYSVNGTPIANTRNSIYDNTINARVILSVRPLQLLGPFNPATYIDTYEGGGFQYDGKSQMDVIYNSIADAEADIIQLINSNLAIF